MEGVGRGQGGDGEESEGGDGQGPPALLAGDAARGRAEQAARVVEGDLVAGRGPAAGRDATRSRSPADAARRLRRPGPAEVGRCRSPAGVVAGDGGEAGGRERGELGQGDRGRSRRRGPPSSPMPPARGCRTRSPSVVAVTPPKSKLIPPEPVRMPAATSATVTTIPKSQETASDAADHRVPQGLEAVDDRGEHDPAEGRVGEPEAHRADPGDAAVAGELGRLDARGRSGRGRCSGRRSGSGRAGGRHARVRRGAAPGERGAACPGRAPIRR